MSLPGGLPGMSGAAGGGDPSDPNVKMVSPSDTTAREEEEEGHGLTQY